MSPGQCATSPSKADRLSRGQFLSSVAINSPICLEHYRLILRLPSFPPTRPGQFLQLACHDVSASYAADVEHEWAADRPPRLSGDELRSPLAILRRPFSLAGRRDVSNCVELEFIYRTVGVGTRWLSELKHGQTVGLLGPLGNCFELPPPDGAAILVGGGVGIPPMLYLASALAGRKAVAFCGALNRDLLPLTITADAPPPQPHQCEGLYNIHEFAQHGIATVVCTDDGSYGFRGLVTEALERYLDRYFRASALSTQHSALSTRDSSLITHRSPTIYTCGPEAMMKRVAAIAADRGIECQVAVERAMACGMGTCQSCCIRVRKPDPSQPPLAGQDWCYRLTCTDGPIFRGAELLW